MTGILDLFGKDRDLNETMYEVNWHYTGDKFSHCSVTPITVLWKGTLPGCTSVSIIAKSSDGLKFKGSLEDYNDTEAAAWLKVKTSLSENISAIEMTITKLTHGALIMREYLATLPSDAALTRGAEAVEKDVDGGPSR